MRILNQFGVHWLLNDALNFFISINLKFKDEIETLTSFDNIMEKDASVALELTYLASNIKKKVYGVLDSFLSFFLIYKEKKPIINIFSLMLYLGFKIFV